MFLWLIGILTIGQMYFEYKIVKALRLESISRKFVLVNLGFSVLITIATGWLFGAAGGMVVVSAGLLSTIFSQPMYNVVTAWQKTRGQREQVRASYLAHKTQIHQTLADLMKVIMIFVLIITFPFRVLRWCIATYEKAQAKYQSLRHHKESIYT